MMGMFSLGSARVSRVGFGVSPEQSFSQRSVGFEVAAQVRDGAEAVAHTRDACATQAGPQTVIWKR